MAEARSALITAATQPIGRGVAQAMARRGYRLTIAAADVDELAAEAVRLRASGAPRVLEVPLDPADHHALSRLSVLHANTFGDLDALVLAGRGGGSERIHGVSLQRVDRTIGANFVAPFRLIHQCLPLLRSAAARNTEHGARILAVGGNRGHAGSGSSADRASDAALLSLVESVDREEARHGVRAAAIVPEYTAATSYSTGDTLECETIIPVEDVVCLIEALLQLSPKTSVPRVVMARGHFRSRLP